MKAKLKIKLKQAKLEDVVNRKEKQQQEKKQMTNKENKKTVKIYFE